MKILKILISGISVLTLLSACEMPGASGGNANAPLTPSGESSEGGISSGGGGTLPADPISIYDFYQVMGDAKHELRMYITGKRYEAQLVGRAEDKYFLGDRNLLTVLEETDIEVLTDKACKDREGHDVDGSIVSSLPNAICISAQRVMPKLIKANAHEEIEALILHEFSHLLGATEAEAIHLQQEMVRRMVNVDREGLRNRLWQLPDEVGDLQSNVAHPSKENNDDPAELRQRLERLEQYMSAFETKYARVTLSIMDWNQTQFFHLQQFRVQMASDYLATLIPGDGQAEAIAYYKKAFNGQSSQTLAQIEKNLGQDWHGDNPYKNESFANLTSMPAFAAEMNLLSAYFDDLWLVGAAYGMNEKIPEMSGPWNRDIVNPWALFAGTYEVTKVACKNDMNREQSPYDNLTTIELVPGSEKSKDKNPKEMTMIKSTANSHFWESFVRNADGRPTFLSGSAGGANRTQFQGDSWYSNNGGESKHTERLEKTDEGYKFKNRFDFKKTTEEGLKTNFTECEYLLRKTTP